jgi:hypothetical protein
MPDESNGIASYLKNWLSLQNPIPTGYQLAEQFAIKIHLSDESPKRGNLVLRAEYSGNPPTITVYRNSLELWLQQLRDQDSTHFPTLEQLIEISIFHEFVHHLFRRPASFFPKENFKGLKKLKRLEEEKIVRMFVQDWLFRRFPDANIKGIM